MSLIAELFNPTVSASRPGPLDDYWYMPIGSATDSGEKVSSDTAMRIATVFACVRVLAETIASLPLFVYRRRKDGGKDKATDHWLYKILHSVPNPKQTSFSWREMCQGHLCLRGNAYSYIDWNRRGRVNQLVPLHPDMVIPKRMADGSIQYDVRGNDGVTKMYLAEEILHVPALSLNGIVGINPIRYMAQSLGLSMAAEKFGARFFKNGTKASGVVMYPATLGDKAQSNLRKSIAKHIGGENVHSPLILEEGAKWEQLSVNPEDAQFLEVRKYQDIDICKIFRIPPHLVGILDRATFSNIENQSIGFVIHTIRPWLVRWEQVINKQLLDNSEDVFAEFNVEGLLRGDIKTRYLAYKIAVSNGGWMNRNEVRKLENLNPVDGLDEYLLPLNMTTSGQRQQQGKSNQKAFKAIASDIAAKIANSEIKAISSRIDKASEDRERFNGWLKDFYEKQSVYIDRCISMVAQINGADGFVSEATTKITKSAIEQFDNQDDAAAIFETFQTVRKYQIEHILSEVLK